MIDEADDVVEVAEEPVFVMIKMGQERCYIIGQVVEESAADVVLHHPMAINMSYHGSDGMRIVINDYLPFAQERLVSIIKGNIHAMTVPKPSLIRYYLKYKKESIEEKMEEYLEARVTGGPDPDDLVTELNNDPPTEHDTKH